SVRVDEAAVLQCQAVIADAADTADGIVDVVQRCRDPAGQAAVADDVVTAVSVQYDLAAAFQRDRIRLARSADHQVRSDWNRAREGARTPGSGTAQFDPTVVVDRALEGQGPGFEARCSLHVDDAEIAQH